MKTLAKQIATYPPTTNFATTTGIARINDMSSADGLFAESLLQAAVRLRALEATLHGKVLPKLDQECLEGKPAE